MTANLISFFVTVGAVVVALLAINHWLRARWKDEPSAQYRYQLIMLTLSVAGLLIAIAALPVSETLRAQFLSLMGILISAAIALASTNFISNIMAGIMLRSMKKARPGDFITVESLTGRISEMDLLHTEIQTEFRDLVTVPNSYMVTRPLKVVRASGSIITGEVSLGYDVSHKTVSAVLRKAAEDSGLSDCFVHVRELGDYSVTYRVAGLLEDIHSLISARAKLLSSMMDALHDAGIEIVSPGFMNTRATDPLKPVIPEVQREPHSKGAVDPQVEAESVAFDKAEDAASMEMLRQAIAEVGREIGELAKEGAEDADALAVAKRKKRRLESALERAEQAILDGEKDRG